MQASRTETHDDVMMQWEWQHSTLQTWLSGLINKKQLELRQNDEVSLDFIDSQCSQNVT